LKITVATALVVSAFALPAIAADSYSIDPNHTFPSFEINHLGFSNLRGVFNSSSGKIVLDPAGKGGSMEISVDTASVTTGQAKRDEHLRSDEFFNVAKFPNMTFKSNKLKYNGDKLVGADGDLTLLGVTKPVSLTVTYFNCGVNPISKKPTCGGNATGTIKRSDFGMKAFAPGISDEVKLFISAEASKD
jgi:polyisoprenoid-binding protein YceI